MYGFTIIYNNTEDIEFAEMQKIEFISSQSQSRYSFYYNPHSKFNKDKCFGENEQFIVGMDGVILNLRQLRKTYALSDNFKLILHLHNQFGKNFINQFSGEFCGFIFDKDSHELLFFTNQAGTKKALYCKAGNSTIISPDLKIISDLKSEIDGANQLNFNAAYAMLTFGGTYKSQTLISGIHKLCAGQLLQVSGDKLSVENYHSFNNIKSKIYSEEKAIELLEAHFSNAIEMEYQKDIEYGYKHIATLSGGLDSRMNVMAAAKMGLSTHNFCFSQSGYADEQISRKISADLGNTYTFIPLDEAIYMEHIEENLSCYNASIFYLAAAHFNFALKKLKLNDFGLIHTGQIGGAVMGGFISKNPDNPDYFSTATSKKLIHKIDFIKTDDYASEEVFKFHNRLFNITVSGSLICENNQSYLCSPFLNTDFIEACLSIDIHLKQNSKLYFKWIEKYRPEIAQYKWEKTGFKPNAQWKNELSRYRNKIKQIYHNKTGQLQKTSMNPYEYWYRKNKNIRDLYKTRFETLIDLVIDKNLNKDMHFLFEKGNTLEKSLVITLLEAINKYNIKA
ncbi:MAG: asparagine synthase-related protein [Chitinophagales bacterium]